LRGVWLSLWQVQLRLHTDLQGLARETEHAANMGPSQEGTYGEGQDQ
jgi:hypothetical protein